jgi:hypothetical protein
VKSERIIEELDKLSESLRIAMEPKPRFPIPKVCHDWLMILYELYPLINIQESHNSMPITPQTIFNSQAWLTPYANTFQSPIIQFGLHFNNILFKYREYFYSDTLLYAYYSGIASLDKLDYNTKNKYFILTPLYALYFLILFNKRFFYSLSIDKSKGGEKKYDFISNANLSKSTIKITVDNTAKNTNKNIVEIAPDEQSKKYNLGKYINSKLTDLLKNIKRLLILFMETQRSIQEVVYNEYFEILKNIFNAIFDMTLNKTDVNNEWVNNTIIKVKNLNELYNGMVLGRSNFFFPTDDHIENLNFYIQEIEKKADEMEINNG